MPVRSTLTIVALHAHPDDESLLTGGSLARAVSLGHRVVVVTCTDGEAGLADGATGLAERRSKELEEAVSILGCHRLVTLGYPDSGSDGTPAPGTFAAQDPQGPAARVAAILDEERADVLISYDAHGGYGHPDHVQVHRVGRLAAEMASTPRLLEATVDADQLIRIAGWLSWVPRLRRLIPPDRFGSSFTPRKQITHEVDVRDLVKIKQQALAAHASQTRGASIRTVSLLARLPRSLATRVLGWEWFSEVGVSASRPRRTPDPFAPD